MKNLNYKFYFACMFITIFLASCKKSFLDRVPKDKVVAANFYQNPGEILAGTAPLYNIVWHAYNDKAANAIGDGRGGTLLSRGYRDIEMNTTATSPENSNSWASFFNTVGQANSVISNIRTYAPASVPQEVKTQAIAEARFMRGLAYSYLVQNWGPVPLITNNNTLLKDTTITRNTVESVWEFIIRDLRFAAQNLPVSAPKAGRITKFTGQGMLARMFLIRSGVGQNLNRRQLDLDSARFYAKEVIDNSGAALVPDYNDLFMMKNNNNKESLFALQWVYNGAWGTQNTVQAQLAFSPSITGFLDGWGTSSPSLDQLYRYETNDKRRKATFMYYGDHYSYIHQKVSDPANPGQSILKELDVPNLGPAYIKKYVVGRPEDNDGKVVFMGTEINTYMLRLAEVYLIYAEAILGNSASTTDSEALKYFNMIRHRAGVLEKTELTWDDIYNERRLEFAMEGQAWYEMTRLHYYNPQKAYAMLSSQDRGSYRIDPNTPTNATSWTIKPLVERKIQVSDANFMLPIPASELTIAPNLRKTPVPYDFTKQN
jgi:hypothetical protein